ncbi:acyl carrier protein [Colwellia sp. M166]|jgi:acyl carrier protein|uniref:acyl carrier protein n=1 Tax=Colwellia sp. M166 TaxID=2583805 RepID=UPI00211F1455|nr:phosphopantetheine-binding protein [Colwellia sp. M166]UUO22786.1 acyl carrier protein [Colwellia sp. M166]|tara:strand:+ start:12170 stop:12436 length:267 start_codon:yes stop_codon:yes gene_type:complete
MHNIEEKLHAIFSEYTDEDFAGLTDAQTLDEVGIDSLSTVEIIFDIEEAFDIKIPDDSVLNAQGSSLSCYADILALVKILVKERQENV